MNLQSSIIRRYRETFPNDTFRKISQKTSIQITRVFRILSGHEMKIREYEKLEEVLNQNSMEENLTTLSKKCFLELSQENLNDLINQMQRKLLITQFKRA